MTEREQTTDSPAGGHLNNVNKVFEYLVENGWKVSRAGVYKHRKAGILQPDDKGRYAIDAVDRYAKQNLRRLDGSRPGAEDEQSSAKRAAEIRKLIAHAKILENKAKEGSAEWIRRGQYEQDLANRAAILKSDLLSWCQSEAEGLCHLVHGDEEMIPDLIQHMIRKIEKMLDRYSR